MKTTSKLALGAAGAALVISGVGAALALSGVLVTPSSHSASATHNVSSTGGGNSVSEPDYLAQLQALSKTQTPAQIAAVEASGGHVEVLVDPSTGAVLAALKTTTVASSFELSSLRG
jgi:hypothetical protein